LSSHIEYGSQFVIHTQCDCSNRKQHFFIHNI